MYMSDTKSRLTTKVTGAKPRKDSNMKKILLISLLGTLAMTACDKGSNNNPTPADIREKVQQIRNQVANIQEQLANSVGISEPVFAKDDSACTISVNVQNNSDKPIKGIQFAVEYYDMYGNLVSIKNYSYKGVLSVGETQTATWDIYTRLQMLQDFERHAQTVKLGMKVTANEDEKIMSLVSKNEVRVKFKTKAIVFEDGTLIRDNSFQ